MNTFISFLFQINLTFTNDLRTYFCSADFRFFLMRHFSKKCLINNQLQVNNNNNNNVLPIFLFQHFELFCHFYLTFHKNVTEVLPSILQSDKYFSKTNLLLNFFRKFSAVYFIQFVLFHNFFFFLVKVENLSLKYLKMYEYVNFV